MDNRDTPNRLTDEDGAFLRHVRFGELPRPVPVEERVESVESDNKHGMPDPEPIGFESRYWAPI